MRPSAPYPPTPTPTPAPSRPGSQRPVPRGLPPLLAGLHRRVAALVERLPSTPPSAAAALLLNRQLLPRLPDDARTALVGRVVALRVTDFGLRVHLRLTPQGFVAAGDAARPELLISATADGFMRLARAQEDPDRLFFERQLMMEGDTELGLVLKNSLDAIGPLWPPAGMPFRA